MGEAPLGWVPERCLGCAQAGSGRGAAGLAGGDGRPDMLQRAVPGSGGVRERRRGGGGGGEARHAGGGQFAATHAIRAPRGTVSRPKPGWGGLPAAGAPPAGLRHAARGPNPAKSTARSYSSGQAGPGGPWTPGPGKALSGAASRPPPLRRCQLLCASLVRLQSREGPPVCLSGRGVQK